MRSASFFAPYRREVETFIRIATGDYKRLKGELVRNGALASILCSFAHEIVRYNQWTQKRPFTEKEATRKAKQLIQLYAAVVSSP